MVYSSLFDNLSVLPGFNGLFGYGQEPGSRNSSSSSGVKRSPSIGQLDVSFLSNDKRIMVIGSPWSARTERKAHRNNIDDLCEWLEMRYKGRFMVFKLCGGKNIEDFNYYKFDYQVAEFKMEPIPESRLNSNNTIWTVGRAVSKFKSSLTKKIDDEKSDLDGDIEQLFVQTQDDNKKGSKGKNDESKTSKAKVPSKISLVDPRRGQNVAIGLKKLRCDNEKITNALLELNRNILDKEKLSIIQQAKLLPTKEEIATVKSFRGDISKLAETEQFFLHVAKVPNAMGRVNAMVFQLKFDSSVEELNNHLDMIKKACEEVKSSEKLKYLMQVILLIGNKINSESESSGQTIQAFTLASLLKLSQTKSFNRKTTILDYVVSFVGKKSPEILKVYEDDLGHISQAKRITITQVDTEQQALDKGLQSVNRLIQKDGINSLEEFAHDAQKTLETLRLNIQQATADFDELLAYFGESSTLTQEEFFSTLDTFFIAFSHSAQNFERQQKRLLREQKRQQTKKQKLSEENENNNKNISTITNNPETNSLSSSNSTTKQKTKSGLSREELSSRMQIAEEKHISRFNSNSNSNSNQPSSPTST